MLMRKQVTPRVYWRQSNKTGVWHCYRRLIQAPGYRSLCGGASLRRTNGGALSRPPPDVRCHHCMASEEALRGLEDLPASYNWDYVSKDEDMSKYIEQIQMLVAQRYGVRVSEMRGPLKPKTLVLARQVAMTIARQLTEASFPEIGRIFGGRDHSTVMNAVGKISQMCKQDPEFKKKYDRLREECEEVVKGVQPPVGDRFNDECVQAGLKK